ncbi:nucleotidyltransferase family protein [Dyella monticola]|uniref:Nucleotidyltransferase family protein n=1 Tax=Dyella monticola TaxID=1927958 RepID=A0A370WTZ8_9GAMM|nr:nucleotidyltransferase family protein [Dyella monticola]RDS79531.1 nucleotidyltransferase family protein [Dyella monticola]
MAAYDHNLPVIVLLAAGEGSRFGSAKQLATIAGEPMLRRVARMLLRIDVPVIVVTGAYADAVETVIGDLPLNIVRCEQWQLGMGQSLATGMLELMRNFSQASAALVCLADQPLIHDDLLRNMLERHAKAPDRILATAQRGILGPPALFPRDCFGALVSLSGPRGAHDILKQEVARVEPFAWEACADVDTPGDLQYVQAWLATAHARSDDH